MIDHKLYGAIAEYETEMTDSTTVKVGYWLGRQQPPGPPVSQRKYTIKDGKLSFAGWNMLAKNETYKLSSPYAQIHSDIGKWSYTFGIRYLDFKVGALHSFTNGTSGTTSSDYATALANGTFDPKASSTTKKFTQLLPATYVSYTVNSNMELYADYTKTYGLDVNLFPSYVTNRANFVAKNVTFQQIWDKQDLELSHNFDIGLKYTHNGITYAPNIFFTQVSGKQAALFDEKLKVKYPSNSVDAQSYGAEFALSGEIQNNLGCMTSLSYNKYYYTQNLKTSNTETKTIKENQIPDTPLYTFKGALDYSIGSWRILPIIKHTTSRYGNVDNTQKIPAYTIVDLDIAYKMPNFFNTKENTLNLQIVNLFDKKYISSIVTPDNALSADTMQPTYLAGMPFGAYLAYSLKF